MSGAAEMNRDGTAIPEFKQLMGHPRPLWMLFMSEFWERFAFYGIRWALVLYIVAQFHGGSPTGQAANGCVPSAVTDSRDATPQRNWRARPLAAAW